MSREVVERDKLTKLIDDFLRPFREETPPGSRASDDRIPEAAAEYLAQKTGKTADTVARSLYRIMRENTSGFVELKTADWIVAVGMGRPDLLHTYLQVIIQGDGERDSGQLPQRKERPPVPPGVPAKTCRGVFCQGQIRPLLEFGLYNAGGGKKKLQSRCTECDAFESQKRWKKWELQNPKAHEVYNRRMRKHQEWEHYGYVPYFRVEFAVEELCSRFGPKKAARLIGVSYRALWTWRTGRSKQVFKENAARILQALSEVRNGNGFHKT